MGSGDGAAAALNAIRTGDGEKDSPDSGKACNMADLDVGGGDGSSSAVSIRAKLRKNSREVAEVDSFLSKNTAVLPCHGSDISKEPDENPNSNDLQLEYVKPVINNVNGSLMIPSDVVNRGSLPYSRTLYGYFFEENEIDLSLVNHHARNMWKTHGVEDIMMNQKGFYFFKFKTYQGMLDALEQGPWTIGSVPIFLKRWTAGLILDKSKHDKLKLPVWIRIYEIPLELWNKEGLSIIGSMLGDPLAVDTCTARMCMKASGRAGYARILVDFDANGNWVDEISVSVPYGNGYSLSTLRVEYSWKPGKCSVCKVFDHTDSNCIHQKVMENSKDNELNEIQLKKDEEEREKKRRDRAQAHMYTVIKVARDTDLLEQIGKDIYFDLVDHDKVRSFRVQKKMPFNLFKEEVAKEFGVPVQFQRFWIWAKRQNNTYRPHHPLTPQEETKLVGQLREVSNKNNNAELKLFLEIKTGPDLRPVPLPEKRKNDILVFFKLYDPEKEQLRYVGSFFVKGSGEPSEIVTKLNERCGFRPDEEIELYEEIKFEPYVMCERLDKRMSFRCSQIEDGDIICFQKVCHGNKYRYPDVPTFLEYVKTCQQSQIQCLKTLKVPFHHATNEKPVIHKITLPNLRTVGDALNEIKTKVKLSHPEAELRLFEVFYHKIYKIFPLTEKIENINDQYRTLIAEEIPDEEKNLGPQDRLINVYHFTKEAAHSLMLAKSFGEPFLLVICENETLASVRVRIQKKLEVSNDDFSKWKFAFVSLRGPTYLQDSDVVSNHFQRRDVYGAWEQYLGLEHSDTTPVQQIRCRIIALCEAGENIQLEEKCE